MKVFVVIAIVAAVVYQQTSAAPAPLEDEKVKGCLAKIDGKIDSLVVPDLVEKLGGFIRSLNANLDNGSLSKLVTDSRADVDVRNAGFISAAEDNDYVESCGDYLSKFKETTQGTECGDDFLLKFDDTSFESFLSEHSKIEEKNGYANVCLVYLQ